MNSNHISTEHCYIVGYEIQWIPPKVGKLGQMVWYRFQCLLSRQLISVYMTNRLMWANEFGPDVSSGIH